MYETIVLATDGSVESYLAAEEVNRFIEMGTVKKVIIVNVVPNYTELFVHVVSTGDLNLEKKFMDAGSEVIRKTRDLITGDVEIDDKLIVGDPAFSICEMADENNGDLVIMGSRGVNPGKGFLMGSVSTRVLALAKCPVLVVKQPK